MCDFFFIIAEIMKAVENGNKAHLMKTLLIFKLL